MASPFGCCWVGGIAGTELRETTRWGLRALQIVECCGNFAQNARLHGNSRDAREFSSHVMLPGASAGSRTIRQKSPTLHALRRRYEASSLQHSHARRQSTQYLSHRRCCFASLLIVLVQSLAVLQHDDGAASSSINQEAFRQLQHDWQSFALVERGLNKSYVPNWRDDGRCGPDWPAPDGSVAVCDPFAASHCCSHWGWCGQSRWHCNQGLLSPQNSTDTGAVISP